MAKTGKIVSGVLAVSVVAGLGIGMKSFNQVQPGYVGVVYSMNGGIQGEVLSQGAHFVSPLHKVKQYSVATEQGYLSKDAKEGSKQDDSFDIPTADGKMVNVDLEYSYHFDVDTLPETFTRFKGQDGQTIEETFMRGKLKTWAGEVSSKFSVIDIFGEKRTDLNTAVLEHVRNKFAEYGIVIDTISFSRIDVDAQTEKAIQDKINKQQELETAKLAKEKADIENQQSIAKAQADAEQKKIQAQADADAQLIRAEAEAEANKKVAASLTADILQSEYLQKWDGKLPTYQGGSGTTPILDLR